MKLQSACIDVPDRLRPRFDRGSAPLPQTHALKSAGCAEIEEEQASGGIRARPVLARVLERIGKGDTLVVVRFDRLARSLSHLLEVIKRLEAKGAFFRSLQDPIDTSSPQGKFTLQVLGAAAEFERALIRERTKAGLASARSEGRVGGNPGLRTRDPAALRKVRLARQDGYMERLTGRKDAGRRAMVKNHPRQGCGRVWQGCGHPAGVVGHGLAARLTLRRR
jgi:DNA invertase Pin-like site-specific DNA recombinase